MEISERIRRLRELRQQAGVDTVHVVTDCYLEWEDPEEYEIWTISTDAKRAGWVVPSGCTGYGLDKAKADYYATAVNSLLPFLEYVESLERVREACKELTDILTNSTADNMARLREAHNKCLAALRALGVPVPSEEE